MTRWSITDGRLAPAQIARVLDLAEDLSNAMSDRDLTADLEVADRLIDELSRLVDLPALGPA